MAASENNQPERTEGERERVAAGFKSLSDEMNEWGSFGENERQENRRQASMEANRFFYEQECREAGVDSRRGYSPSLEKLVSEQNAKRTISHETEPAP